MATAQLHLVVVATSHIGRPDEGAGEAPSLG